jgi:hypothetical protein
VGVLIEMGQLEDLTADLAGKVEGEQRGRDLDEDGEDEGLEAEWRWLSPGTAPSDRFGTPCTRSG